jgi:hypothetical protein
MRDPAADPADLPEEDRERIHAALPRARYND